MKPDASKFKKPATWATYCEARTEKFKMHSAPSKAKVAITGIVDSYGRRGRVGEYEYVDPQGRKRKQSAVPVHIWVYQFDPDLDEWIEVAHFEPGDRHRDHQWWKAHSPERQTKQVSDDVIEATIESIVASARRRG